MPKLITSLIAIVLATYNTKRDIQFINVYLVDLKVTEFIRMSLTKTGFTDSLPPSIFSRCIIP